MPDYKTEDRSKYEIWWTFGWPYETSAAMARLVFGGVMDRLPQLKVMAHHLGAMVPYFEGRVGPGWDQLGKRTTDEDLAPVLQIGRATRGEDGEAVRTFQPLDRATLARHLAELA